MSILSTKELLNNDIDTSLMWVSLSLVPPLNLYPFWLPSPPLQSNHSLPSNPDAPLILVHRQKGLEVNGTPRLLRRQFKIDHNYANLTLLSWNFKLEGNCKKTNKFESILFQQRVQCILFCYKRIPIPMVTSS